MAASARADRGMTSISRLHDLEKTGIQAVPWHFGFSPEARPVEELTPGCVLEVRIPASAFSDGFFVRGWTEYRVSSS